MKSKKEFERRVKAQESDTEIGSNEAEACLRLMSSSVINVAWHDWLCENPLFIIFPFSGCLASAIASTKHMTCYHVNSGLLVHEKYTNTFEYK